MLTPGKTMNKTCPDCGKTVDYHADDCPHCAFWLESEFTGYLGWSFFGALIPVLFLGLILWILNQP